MGDKVLTELEAMAEKVLS